MAKIKSTSTEETVQKNNESNDTLKTILERLEKVEKENAELKAKGQTFKKAKEINTDPRKFSYKIWAGVPVLSYKSVRKDPSKDLVYKNQFGQYDSNHYLELKLANGKTETVEVTEFGKAFTTSEKLDCTDAYDNPIMIGDKPNKIKFTTSEWGSFLVDLNIVN